MTQIGGPEVLTYGELVTGYAEEAGLRRPFGLPLGARISTIGFVTAVLAVLLGLFFLLQLARFYGNSKKSSS